jgi:hypothetical protein
MIKKLLQFGTISLLIASCTKSSLSEETPVDEVKLTSEIEEVEVQEEPKPMKKMWTCPTCTTNEKHVLEEIQKQTKIYDKNALATIMGNIKQESKFIPNICEGGAIVSYENCLSGGYGLIQWTSINRYRGLGNFAVKYDCNPSELDCQVRWMINEPIFQRVLPRFEGGGQTVSYYMRPAYYWLGWGIKGNREVYAWDYTKKFVLT